MKKYKNVYFCSNCRKSVPSLSNLYFIEENSHKGFCSELCIEKYYLPIVEYFEKIDADLKELDPHHSGNFDYLQNTPYQHHFFY